MLPAELAAPLDELRARRPDLALDVRWFLSVTSTMDVAAALLLDGPARGVVVLADAQTAGRGRRGRTWASPPGSGVYLSLILNPSARALATSLLTLAAGVGVREGLHAAAGLDAELKWPNDVVVGRRKVAGILAEGAGIGTAGATVIVGVGINVRRSTWPPDVAARATSVEAEVGQPVSRGRIVAEVLAAVLDRVTGLEREAGDILQAWRVAAPSAVGTPVEWTTHKGIGRGLTAGVDETGALLIDTDNGIERVLSGEIRWPTVD